MDGRGKRRVSEQDGSGMTAPHRIGPEAVSAWIRQLRRERAAPRTAVARLSGVPHQTLHRWETDPPKHLGSVLSVFYALGLELRERPK